MTLFELFVSHLKGGAYRFRLALLLIGWMWFCLGMFAVAAIEAFPDEAVALLYHGTLDILFGLAHLYLARKAKTWKQFDHVSKG